MTDEIKRPTIIRSKYSREQCEAAIRAAETLSIIPHERLYWERAIRWWQARLKEVESNDAR